jgi:hypothetical protein
MVERVALNHWLFLFYQYKSTVPGEEGMNFSKGQYCKKGKFGTQYKRAYQKRGPERRGWGEVH